jgi:hypothetical protein
VLRNLIVLAALGAILIVLNRLSPIVAEWHYVVPSTPGEVLYAATFDDAAADWELYSGRLSAQVADGALRVTVGEPDSLPFSTAAPYFSDFDLRVKTAAVAGPLDNGYGVIFRAQDSDNYFLFLISSDGYYQVRREVNGAEKILSEWIPSELIHQGLNTANEIRVVAQGDTFQFYVNGTQVELCIPNDPDAVSTYVDSCVDGQMLPQLVDNSIAEGQIGVIALTFDEPGVEVDFDNVLVFGPASE